jgi:hypothetical protein
MVMSAISDGGGVLRPQLPEVPTAKSFVTIAAKPDRGQPSFRGAGPFLKLRAVSAGPAAARSPDFDDLPRSF